MTIAEHDHAEPAPVRNPAKLLRIGSMAKQLLEEIHVHPLDRACRDRLVVLHARAVAELVATLPEPLRHELTTVIPGLGVNAAVSDAQLRIAQAQLVGWLEGLFQGAWFATTLPHAKGNPR